MFIYFNIYSLFISKLYLFEAGQMAGYAPDHVRLDHVGFGVVLGEDKWENIAIVCYIFIHTDM